MVTINRKAQALAALSQFANFSKAKLAASAQAVAQIELVDAMLTKADALPESFFAPIVESKAYVGDSAEQGRMIAKAVLAAGL